MSLICPRVLQTLYSIYHYLFSVWDSSERNFYIILFYAPYLFLFSIFYGILEQSPPIIPSFSEHILIASLLAGLFVGIGVGLVILGGGAAGGDDVIALVFAKCTRLEVNHFYLISDLVVLFISLSYLSSKQISYSLIAVYTSGKIISIFHRSLPDTNLMSGLVQ